MSKKYYKIRIFLLMAALGLASVPFFKSLYSKFILDSINLPQISSNSPLIVSPQYRNEMNVGGGSGPDGADEPQETINTLGSEIRPHVIKNINIKKIKLNNADLIAANIENSDFSFGDLKNANFSEASVIYSSFISTNLTNANFTGAKLFGSDLTNADFSAARFVQANFAASDFSDANLKNVDLTDTNLSDARLESVKGLTYEQLSKAIINKFTTLPAEFESKRYILLGNSRQRMKELKKRMSSEELELFSNEFDFLD